MTPEWMHTVGGMPRLIVAFLLHSDKINLRSSFGHLISISRYWWNGSPRWAGRFDVRMQAPAQRRQATREAKVKP
jgi:hypothetical protein